MRARTLALLGTLVLASPAAAQDAHWLVVSGLGGEAEYRDLFRDWGTRLVSAVRPSATSVRYLAERPAEDAGRIDGASRKERIELAFDTLAASTNEGDQVVIVLIGHGSSDENGARINLPGPDLSAADFAIQLDRLPGRRIVFVNTASASGAFVEELSAAGRVVLTATKTAGERNQTRFGGFFVQALEDAAADADKNGRVSVLEAFQYARRETLRTYEDDGKLATEHALLDDNADGRGSETPEALSGEGSVAATLYLTRTSTADVPSDDPAVRALVAERERLERAVAELRQRKDSMDPERYEQELETLLLELAAVNRRLRGGGS
ncbi:MAG: C13 family peptidase [Gemmatimonadota bacterium]